MSIRAIAARLRRAGVPVDRADGIEASGRLDDGSRYGVYRDGYGQTMAVLKRPGAACVFGPRDLDEGLATIRSWARTADLTACHA